MKYRGAHFSLKTLADKLTAEKATLRFIALQRSGRYSELRIVPRQGGRLFRIIGYAWPDRTTRRRLGVSRVTQKKNPSGSTPNQVYFGQRGKTKVGWINQSTPTKYNIAYKENEQLKTVWRKKENVTFVSTGRRGKKNPCPTGQRNPLKKAVRLSKEFYQLDPRRIVEMDFKPPRSLVKVGECARVDYVNDKYDGKVRRYYHEFEKRCRIYADPEPQKNGDSVLIIIGKFKIKPEGLIY